MTPKRKATLEWVRDDGVLLECGIPGEPSRSFLTRLENEDLITFGTPSADGRGLRYTLTEAGREALSNYPGGQYAQKNTPMALRP